MGYKDRCLMCGKEIDSDLLQCPYCGHNQYGQNNEYYPDEKAVKAAKAVLQNNQSSRLFGKKQKKEKPPIFSEEECFLYGIHPNDKLYRKFMELDILSKDYRK
jgi:CRISPR/Cas system CSM-associated protein Csm3 (group 7 of RAMP superfamily)